MGAERNHPPCFLLLLMRCLKTVGKVRPKRVQRAGGQLRRCTSSLLSRACHSSFWLKSGAVALAPVPRSSERPAASRDHWEMGRPLLRKALGSLVFSPHRCGQPSGEFSQVSCRPYTVMSNSPYDGAITSLPRPVVQ